MIEYNFYSFKVLPGILFLVFFFCLLSMETPQNQSSSERIDSLYNLLTTAEEDTNKVNILNALGWEYKYKKPEYII